MLCRQAGQGLIEQAVSEHLPVDEGRLQPLFAGVVAADGVHVAAIVELRQAVGEQARPARLELGVVQVLGRALERVEECPRQRREQRFPAQQPEQAVEQGIFHVVHLPALRLQVQLDRLLHTQDSLLRRQPQLDQGNGRFAAPGLRRPAQLALQARQHARQGLDFEGPRRLPGNLQGLLMGLRPLLAALEHPDPTNARLRVLAVRVHLQGQVPVPQAFAVLAKLEQHAGAAAQQPGVVAVHRLDLRQHLVHRRALLKQLGAAMQGQGHVDIAALAQGS
ncbi:hypothetical protein D3C77_388690 [compost metagenome]